MARPNHYPPNKPVTISNILPPTAGKGRMPLLINGREFFKVVVAPRRPTEYLCISIAGLPEDATFAGYELRDTDELFAVWYESASYSAIQTQGIKSIDGRALFISTIELPYAMPIYMQIYGLHDAIVRALDENDMEALSSARESLKRFRRHVLRESQEDDNAIPESFGNPGDGGGDSAAGVDGSGGNSDGY